MLSYETVMKAKLDDLDEAVTAWGKLQTQYQALADRIKNEVINPLNGNWRGETAEATLGQLSKAKSQASAAGEEADNIHKLLKDAAQQFRDAQNKLKKIANVDGPKDSLHVSSTGVVTDVDPTLSDTTAKHDPDFADYARGRKNKVEALANRIKSVLTQVTADDDALAYTLPSDATGNAFKATGYTSLDAAEAKEATDIMKKGNKATDAELTKLDHLLSVNKNDPQFSEAVATGMGGRGSLEYWAAVADPYQGGPVSKDRLALLKNLQKDYGTTLATATRVHSKAMDAWEKEVIDLGDKRLDIDDAGNPYGFQVMSNLMRYGNYDSAFLDSYGDKLLKVDKAHNKDLTMFWAGNFNTADLNPAGTANDRGDDPMTGFMEALGHSPDASTDFFDKGDNLDYLMDKRDWPSDKLIGAKGGLAGYDSLGHALESATLGHAYDDPNPSLDHRDAKSADVMEKIVKKVGDDPDLLNRMKPLADSVANMGAGYIDDLNWAAANVGNAGDAVGRDSVFPAGDRNRMDVSFRGATSFLYALGRNEDTHATISLAQQAYTSAILADSHTSHSAAQEAARVGAYVHGAVDEGRVDQIEADYKDKEDAKNQAIAASNEWKKSATELVVGTGVGLITAPTAGVGSVAVPIALSASESAVNTFFGNMIDADAPEADYSNEARMDKTEFTDSGVTSSVLPLKRYFTAADVPQHERGDMLSNVEDGYAFGQRMANPK